MTVTDYCVVMTMVATGRKIVKAAGGGDGAAEVEEMVMGGQSCAE